MQINEYQKLAHSTSLNVQIQEDNHGKITKTLSYFSVIARMSGLLKKYYRDNNYNKMIEFQDMEMNLEDLSDVIDFQNRNNRIPDNLVYPVLGLVDELGEFIDAVDDYNNDVLQEINDPEHLKSELGDVFWYLFEIATVLNFDVEEICDKNLDKLLKRKATNTINGDGENR